MSKIIKILFVFFIILFIISVSFQVYATEIDMNLIPDDSYDFNSNFDSDFDFENPIDLEDENIEDISSTSMPSYSVGATTEEGLSLSNILNILLITVGVILILLAIAILIRLK